MRTPPRRYDYTKPLQGQQIAPVLKATAPDLDRVMRPVDQKAFAYTAWWFNVYILVRRSNEATVPYIGRAGFTPKGPDTKAKTAQQDFVNPHTGRPCNVGGLVCNPRAPGMAGAYVAHKYPGALKEWDKFVRTGRLDQVDFASDGTPSKHHLRECFFVDLRPDSERFGALMYSRNKMTLNACYIHGDYDLFAIVPADNPRVNIVVEEQHPLSPWHPLNRRPGMPPTETDPARKSADQKAQEILNFRGRKFIDVQNMLNRMMGVSMILHGSQEKAVNSFDEAVDVFFPDGERSCCISQEADLRRFYEGQLQGRQLFNFMGGGQQEKGAPIPGAQWRRIG